MVEKSSTTGKIVRVKVGSTRRRLELLKMVLGVKV